jgi:hypothetical protein
MFKGLLLFGAGAFFLGMKASSNDRGVVLQHLIQLGPEGATIFYWCFAAACAVFALAAFMLILFGLFSNQVLSISETELSAPKSLLSPANTIVPLSSILRLELKSVRNQHFLSVYHEDGKLTIASGNLPDTEAFGDVCARLADRDLDHGAAGSTEPAAYTRAPLLDQPFTRRVGEKAGLWRILVVVGVFAALLFTAVGIMALLKMAAG